MSQAQPDVDSVTDQSTSLISLPCSSGFAASVAESRRFASGGREPTEQGSELNQEKDPAPPADPGAYPPKKKNVEVGPGIGGRREEPVRKENSCQTFGLGPKKVLDASTFPDFSDLPGIEVEPYNEEPALSHTHSRADLVQVQTRGVSSSAQQRSLMPSSEVFALSVAAKLRELGRTDLCVPLEACHTEHLHLKCNSCSKVNTVWNRCDLFYCPRCQPRLARERAEGVEFWSKEVAQPKHIVLTTMNSMSLTTHHVRHLIKSFARLRGNVFCRKVTYWWITTDGTVVKRLKQPREDTATHKCVRSQPWRGGFYRLELTNEGKGWHLHLHALVDSNFIDARILSHVWFRASKQTGNIVKVKDCRDKSYLAEVTKYAVKGNMLAEWDGAEIAEFIDAFMGVRTFSPFGSLYGLRAKAREFFAGLAERRATCECGGCSYTVQSDADMEWFDAKMSLRRPNAPPLRKPDQQLELGVIVRSVFNLYS